MTIHLHDIANILTNCASEIKHEMTGHIEDQPFSITCTVCGEDLDVNCSIDNDLDLTILVEPHKCEGA